MNLKPLGDRLIVEPLEEEQTTIGGIVLPDTAVEKPQRGTVVAAGPGSRNSETGERIPMDVAEGAPVVTARSVSVIFIKALACTVVARPVA